jgi:hypothetical protein
MEDRTENIIVDEEIELRGMRMDAPSSDGDIEDNDSVSSDDSTYDEDDAQQQWEESVEQLQKLFTLIILPLTGKFFGRRFAYYTWMKYVEYENAL